MNEEEFLIDVDCDALHVTIDRAKGNLVGTVILVPPFGMSAERMFPAAFMYVQNGFDVYRFDPRNHPGRSTGSIEAFTLSGLARDVTATLDLVPHALVVGVSLSARAAIRALTNRSQWAGAVLITPVVNVSSTLLEVFGADLFARLHSPSDYPSRNRILGYDVDMTFVADCVEAGMVSSTDTMDELCQARNRITLLAGTDDPWVSISEVRQVAREAREHGSAVDVVAVQSATHQLYRNPVLGMTFFHNAVKGCLEIMHCNPDGAIRPAFSEIIAAIPYA